MEKLEATSITWAIGKFIGEKTGDKIKQLIDKVNRHECLTGEDALLFMGLAKKK